MWKKVINLKYHTEEGGWFTRELRGSFRVDLWKDISKGRNKMNQDCYFVWAMTVE